MESDHSCVTVLTTTERVICQKVIRQSSQTLTQWAGHTLSRHVSLFIHLFCICQRQDGISVCWCAVPISPPFLPLPSPPLSSQVDVRPCNLLWCVIHCDGLQGSQRAAMPHHTVWQSASVLCVCYMCVFFYHFTSYYDTDLAEYCALILCHNKEIPSIIINYSGLKSQPKNSFDEALSLDCPWVYIPTVGIIFHWISTGQKWTRLSRALQPLVGSLCIQTVQSEVSVAQSDISWPR